MEISVKGKKALVTGASRGIGRAITETLLKAGASKVYAVDVLKDELDKFASEVANVHPIHLDLCDWSTTKATLSTIEPVDYLVNNAGVFWPTKHGTIKESDYDKIFTVNVKSMINVTQIITTTMIKSGIKGSIVNTSSIQSLTTSPDNLVYSSSKAAIDHVTRNFAAQLASDNIRVNAINPWSVSTSMLPSDAVEAEIKANPFGKLIEPEEIGKIVLFLLSDWSAAINGITLRIDYGIIL